eukprot:3173374-Prymnesium_polylepis.1
MSCHLSLQRIWARRRAVVSVCATNDGTSLRVVPLWKPTCAGGESHIVAGDLLSITVRKAGQYRVCDASAGDHTRTAVAQLEVVNQPEQAFRCGPLFHGLCPSDGIGTLPASDVHLALAAGLKVFLYESVPPKYHWALWRTAVAENGRIASGVWCDFVRSPCVPPNRGLHRVQKLRR